jgi:cyclic beta-1,2-glucan synthetase
MIPAVRLASGWQACCLRLRLRLRLSPGWRRSAPPALELPIRAELLGHAGFAQRGAQLAAAHGTPSPSRRPSAFFPRLRQNIAVLQQAHRTIAAQAARGTHVSPAGEWLLDNIHLVAAQTREVHDGLPRRFFRRLPVLAAPPLAGLPRVYGIAWTFVAHADSAFEPLLLQDFLCAYQQQQALTHGELWALPTTLRVVLVENLRRLAERVAADQDARDAAHALCDSLARGPQDGAPSPQAQFDRHQALGVGRAFALLVMQRLHADSETGSVQGAQAREALRVALALALPDPAAAQAQQQADQAADNVSVGHAIRSLQLLGSADWRGLVAACSPLMQSLLTLPVFAAERDDTQDSTLHAIEQLARRSGHSEVAVARQLMALVQGPSDPAQPRAAPGHWLHGEGQAAMAAALGLRVPRWTRARRQQLMLPLWMASIVLGTLGLTALFVLRAPVAAGPLWASLGVALLALWPASEVVQALVNRLASELSPPRRLPRLALDEGIPPAQRVLVVLPCLLTDAATIGALAQRLERHHLANRERHAQFALLSDWADADSASTPSDAPLLQAAQAALAALNQRSPQPPGLPPRFVLLHRARRWSDSEQRWIGWERKRGKLEQLLARMSGAGPAAGPFVDLGAASCLHPATPHVLTLDGDTVLPPGALRDLVGLAAHPLNQPRIALRAGGVPCVVAGHGILQPRLAAAWPEPGQDTLFHRLFAGARGSDPYNAAASEVYQDLFDEGSFSGKGLLHVTAVHAVLAGRLPEGQVLSHDLLEGCIARCGSVGDVALIEPAPTHADVAASRVHRWTRGDWQLLPLLLQAGRYGLGALHRWKLADNLRRSLVAPAALALLLLALIGGPVSPAAALALALAAFGTGPLVGAVAGLAPSRDDLALGHFARQALAELARAAGDVLWQLALWLRHSAAALDAIARALWRSAVSHRALLQWTTAAAAERAAQHGLGPLLRRHVRVLLLALGLGAMLWLAGTPAPATALALALLWSGTPLWIAGASRAWPPAVGRGLNAVQQREFEAMAHDTWRWFAQHVGPCSHHLPPDNVQTVPQLMVAQRTSPTNIGLYLLAVASARAFGWIESGEMASRLRATLDTLDRLPRERGHLLNWIDTRTLQPLLPAYVSTVDSGNLCGHLLAVAQACDQQASAGGEAFVDLATRCRTLAEAADFGFLYDRRRRLLHIGWRVADQQLDAGHYDLLASESRLASLWAIAKGDVPAAHWAALGRPFQAAGGDVGLRSWSGSMFEYLMPALVLDELPGSVLARASRMAVHEQQAFGRRNGQPWGVSESAYAATDRTLAYQYAPQGVPRLALRRTPADERVVAPYASVLAAMVDPVAALANLHTLQALQARGPWGWLEALDFTPDRQLDGSQHRLVSTCMAHHQGMVLVALANVLLSGAPRRWGMADARIAAVATLLHERVPLEVARVADPDLAGLRGPPAAAAAGAARPQLPGTQALPRTQLLGNGRYSVALRANGAGWSRLGDADISRWRDDALRDAYGSFVYLRRDAADGGPPAAVASITQHPAPSPEAHYSAVFHSDRVCLDAAWPDLRSRCTVWVSPEDDVELRRVELWNTSSRPITLELLSAFEPCLAPARADEMHPALANLFISAQWDAHDQALLLSRRSRRAEEPGLHAAHFVAHADAGVLPVRALADRARWQGRLRTAAQPLADFDPGPTPDGPCSTGLDPVAALALRLTLPPHGTAQVTLGTAAAAGLDTLKALVDRYRQASAVDRSSQLSATLAALQLRDSQPVPDDLAALQALSTLLAMVHARPAPPAPASDEGVDRRLLWRLGVSGDRPLVVVTIPSLQGLRLVRVLVQGLALWARAHLPCDLVLINAEPRSYLLPLQHALQALRDEAGADPAAAGRCTQLVLLRSDELSAAERATLALLARVRLGADGRSLAQHLGDLAAWHEAAQLLRDQTSSAGAPAASGWPLPMAAAGRFDPDDGAFSFQVSALRPTPRPWVNVLANPDFGTLVSEAGGSCTWAGNSRLHQLSPWGNDVLGDMAGERFCVQDLRSRALWNLGAGPGCAAVPYRVVHAPGRTSISHQLGDLALRLQVSVDPRRAAKRVQVTLHNTGSRAQRWRVLGAVQWLLGAVLVDRQTVRTACQAGMLLATQQDGHDGAAGHTAFLMPSRDDDPGAPLADWTCDRRELFDARGQPIWPNHLGQRQGAGDPCAAASLTLDLAPGARAGCSFLIGHGPTPQAALALALQLRGAAPAAPPPQLLDALQVHSPDPLFDALVNHWLLAQVTACRLWGRAGFYQAGGAYGFRDQLQDAMALVHTAPQLLREHLLRAAARQFVQGDVQHWWHPHSGAGVRTRFSDDLLWLPHAAVHYVACTGDATIYDEDVSFIEADALAPGAEDAYTVPRLSDEHASLYEHCARSIDRSLALGAHGLPLMGGGDWNDGMNRVGAQGRGESVWLGWFLCRVVADFAPVAQARLDGERAARWLQAASGWRQALHTQAWDGQWYLRAFFDDGTPLGSHRQAECRIDLVAQAWSVLSDAAPPERQRQAMDSAARELFDPTLEMLRLLHPPLVHARPDAGYIQAYPPGVRENGAQYTHAAVWAAMAWAQLGDGDAAWRAWVACSPAHRAADARLAAPYGLEPYAVAADICSQPPYAGRGGWSWYTGSAAGLYRAAVNSICGLQVQGSRLRLLPALPCHWPSVTLMWRHDGGVHRFTICHPGPGAPFDAALARGARPLPAGTWIEQAALGRNSDTVVR